MNNKEKENWRQVYRWLSFGLLGMFSFCLYEFSVFYSQDSIEVFAEVISKKRTKYSYTVEIRYQTVSGNLVSNHITLMPWEIDAHLKEGKLKIYYGVTDETSIQVNKEIPMKEVISGLVLFLITALFGYLGWRKDFKVAVET